MGNAEVLGITKLVNWLLGKPALALLAFLHLQPDDPKYPIPNHIAMELLVFVIAILFFTWLKGRVSAERPGATQQCMEMVLTNSMGVGIKDLVDDIVGHGAERHIPLMGTIGIFILMCNLISVIPGFMSPTAVTSVPFACAIIVFLYYNRFGIGKHGPGGYAKTLMGPVPAISPIMVLIETISHFARMLSLTVRLWANMMVSELIYVIFLGLTVALFAFLGSKGALGYVSAILPIGVPMALILFHIFEAVLQAFIFTILAIVYLGLAVAEEH